MKKFAMSRKIIVFSVIIIAASLIITNAIQAMEEKGEIKIKTTLP